MQRSHASAGPPIPCAFFSTSWVYYWLTCWLDNRCSERSPSMSTCTQPQSHFRSTRVVRRESARYLTAQCTHSIVRRWGGIRLVRAQTQGTNHQALVMPVHHVWR